MKKLMTMIAAVATAFGLFAQELPSPVVDTVDFSDTEYTFTTDAKWTYNGAAISEAPADKVWVANSLLNLATGSNKVSRTFVADGAATITDAIYLDANINFEDPFDEAPVISDSDNAKIAAFVLDNSGALDELVEKGGTPAVDPSTNLYAIAAYYNGETWEKRAFMFVSLDEDDLVWNTAKRLTIKAYGDVMAGAATRMGFRFFLNGESEIKNALAVRYVFPINDDGSIDFTTFIDARDTTTPYLGEGVKASLEAAVRSRCSDRTLVLGLTDVANELVGFDLAGKGELANFTLTTASPAFIDGDSQTVTLDLLNTTVTVTGEGVIDYDQTTITFAGDDDITVTATYAEGKSDIVKWTKNGSPVTPTDDSYSWKPNNNDVLAISAKAAGAYVDGVPFESFFDDEETGTPGALTYVNEHGGTLKLAADVTAAEAYILFSGTEEAILDLAGKTIAGENFTTIYNTGLLTITNSVGTGHVAAYEGSSIINAGTLTIAEGVIDGSIANGFNDTPGTLYITGGTFDGAITSEIEDNVLVTTGGNFKQTVFEAATDVPGVPPTGYAIVGTEVSGYWTVIEKTEPEIEYVTFTVTDTQSAFESSITFKTNNEEVVFADNKYTVETNAEVTIVYTLKADFKDPVIKYDGVTVENGTFVASNANAVVAFSATEKVYAEIPEITDTFTYTGNPQTAITAGTGYTVVSGATETNVGDYKAIVALAPGYDAWNDKTTANKELDWSIEKASNAIAGAPTQAGWTAGQAPVAPDLTGVTATFGTDTLVAAYYSDLACTEAMTPSTETPAGTYYVRAEVAGTVNYDGAVSAAVAFTVAAPAPAPKPFDPDEPITTDKTADEINNLPAAQATALKKTLFAPPTGSEVTDTYYTYFSAVDAGEGKVRFALNEAGQTAILNSANTEIVKVKPDKIAAGTEDSVSIEDPIPGFYYAVKQGNGIGQMKVVYEGQLATGSSDEINLQLQQYSGSGFYQIVVSPTEIKPEN